MINYQNSTSRILIIVFVNVFAFGINLQAESDIQQTCITDVKAFFSAVESTYLSENRSEQKSERALKEILSYIDASRQVKDAKCASELLYRGIDISSRLEARELVLNKLIANADDYMFKFASDPNISFLILAKATLQLNRGELNNSRALVDSALLGCKPLVKLKHIASAHLIRGYAYEGMDDFDRARADFIQAYALYKSTSKFTEQRISALNAAAVATQKIGSYSEAEDYLKLIQDELLTWDSGLHELKDAYAIYLTLAKLNFYTGRVKEAYRDGEVAMNLAREQKDIMRISRVNMVMGELAYQNKDYVIAKSYLEEALEGLNLQGDARFKASTIKYLSGIYKVNGDYKTAFAFSDMYSRLQDSLMLASHQFVVEGAKNEVANARLKQELIRSAAEAKIQEEQQAQFKLLIMLAVSVFFSLVFLLVSLYFKYRDKKKIEKALELEVLQRTKQLEEQKTVLSIQAEKLKQSNQELERFAYVASHDLKTPLRNISSFLGLIKRRITPESLEDAKEYFDIVNDSCIQMNQLISDILDFSKVENEIESKIVDIDLRELVDGVTKQFTYYEKEKNATIEISGQAKIVSHPSCVGQVVKNLIENGLKYNNSTFPMIKVDICENGNNVNIIIQDNGIGIPQENHKVIFEMFKRLHTNDIYKGTGVGLAVCAKIASRLGGRIDVDSSPGEGSTFTLTLPSMCLHQLDNSTSLVAQEFQETSLN